MSKPIYTCLWFNGNALEAANYYCTIFSNSKIISQNPMVVMFELNNSLFMGLNGGSQYLFSPATSFVIECNTQEEIDHYWEKLGKDGAYNRCGWLDDKFGISWQVIPSVLPKLMSDPKKAQKVTETFLKMTKFEIEPLLNC